MFRVFPLSTKLHYTDIGFGYVVRHHHHQRTSSQQFYNLLYNKFATSQCQSPTSRHVKMLGCGKFLFVGGEFVVEQQVVKLLWARPLVVLYNMSVAGVRVVEFGTNRSSSIGPSVCMPASTCLFAAVSNARRRIVASSMNGSRCWRGCHDIRSTDVIVASLYRRRSLCNWPPVSPYFPVRLGSSVKEKFESIRLQSTERRLS